MKTRVLLAIALCAALIVALVAAPEVASADVTRLAAPSAASAPVDPAVGLAAAAPDEFVDAVVVMKSQADLRVIGGRTRRERLAGVERALREAASTGQRGVLGLLRARQARQQVARVTPLWIANEVAIRATPSVIRELAARPDVREIRAELTVTAPCPRPPERPPPPPPPRPPWRRPASAG